MMVAQKVNLRLHVVANFLKIFQGPQFENHCYDTSFVGMKIKHVLLTTSKFRIAR